MFVTDVQIEMPISIAAMPAVPIDSWYLITMILSVDVNIYELFRTNTFLSRNGLSYFPIHFRGDEYALHSHSLLVWAPIYPWINLAYKQNYHTVCPHSLIAMHI